MQVTTNSSASRRRRARRIASVDVRTVWPHVATPRTEQTVRSVLRRPGADGVRGFVRAWIDCRLRAGSTAQDQFGGKRANAACGPILRGGITGKVMSALQCSAQQEKPQDQDKMAHGSGLTTLLFADAHSERLCKAAACKNNSTNAGRPGIIARSCLRPLAGNHVVYRGRVGSGPTLCARCGLASRYPKAKASIARTP